MRKVVIMNLEMIVTNKCNLDCCHCMRGQKCDNSMGNEVIEATLGQVIAIHNLGICGGEPTLAVDVIENHWKVTIERDEFEKHYCFDIHGIRFEMHYKIETFGSVKHQKYFNQMIDITFSKTTSSLFKSSSSVKEFNSAFSISSV